MNIRSVKDKTELTCGRCKQVQEQKMCFLVLPVKKKAGKKTMQTRRKSP